MKTNLNTATKATPVKNTPGYWTHFAISMAMVGSMLAANFSAKAADSFSVEVIGNGKPVIKIPGLMSDASIWQPTAKALYQQQIATINNATLEFNHQSRHFMMLDQPDWLTTRISRALQE